MEQTLTSGTEHGCFLESQEYPTHIDGQLLITDVLELGKYDTVTHSIPGSLVHDAQQSNQGVRHPILRLFGFTKEYDPYDQVEKLRRNNLQPCNLAELLAFGIQYPHEQRKFSIAAFGSWEMFDVAFIWVPCLWSEHGRRFFGFKSPFAFSGTSHRLLCMPMDAEFEKTTFLYRRNRE